MNDDGAGPEADAAAMQALAGGRDTALNPIMERWRDKVLAFLERMTGSRETALDLAQESFVRVYQARRRYDPRQRFSTWLFSIAANLARNRARWQARHPECELPPDDTRPDKNLPPDASADARERIQAVQRAMAELPHEWREALILSVFHDLPQAEIARALGVSAKAVEARIYRARQQLREALRDEV